MQLILSVLVHRGSITDVRMCVQIRLSHEQYDHKFRPIIINKCMREVTNMIRKIYDFERAENNFIFCMSSFEA